VKLDFAGLKVKFTDRDRALKRAVESHLELASRYLDEGRRLVDKDPVQASEKLYKASEEETPPHPLVSSNLLERLNL
jgi:hypothetical protein